MPNRAVRRLTLAALLAAAAPAALAVNLEDHRVAFSGVTGAYGPQVNRFSDGTFGTFAQPTINNSLQVAFSAGYADANAFSLFGGSDGVWLYTRGSGIQIAAQAFGAGNPVILDVPFLDNSGNLAFRGTASGGASAVFYRDLPAALDISSRTGVSGSEGPDIASTTFGTVANSAFSMVFRNGHAAYDTTLTTGGAITFNNDDVLVRSDNGGQAVSYARQGVAGTNPLGPGVAGRTWGSNFVVQSVNSRGDIAFLSGFTGGSFGEPSMYGKIDGVTGAVTFIAIAGTTGSTGPNIPGSPSSTFTFIQGSGRIGLNDAGDTVYFGRSGTSQPNVLLKRTGNTTQFLADAGDTLDGVLISGFSSLSDPIIAGNGDVFFEAQISGGSHTALFRHNDVNGFDLLTRTGSLVHGPGPNLSFVDINGLAANAKGDIAFYAQLSGTGVTGSNDEALIAIRDGIMKIIVREGDLFDIDPTSGQTLKTIHTIIPPAQYINTGGQDGRRSYINDYGDIVFGLTFTDFSTGIFLDIVSVPEPTSLTLLTLASLTVLRRRR